MYIIMQTKGVIHEQEKDNI